MLVSAVPVKIDIIFGSGASGTYIRAIPDTTADPNAASWTLGYPPNTFVDPGAGGKPPDGRDMNGLPNRLSAWINWSNAGGPIFYDSAFSATIGGYPKWSMLANAATPGLFWISSVDNNTSDPDTGGANWLTFPTPAAANVSSFNTRTGAVVLTSADVTSALSANSLVNAKLATMAALTVKANVTGSGATPADVPLASFLDSLLLYAQFQNQQASGTASGESFSANTWGARTLNTTIANTLGITLTGNQMTGVVAGTYIALGQGFAQKFDSQSQLLHKMRVRDVTHGVTVVDGQNAGILGYAGTTIIGTNSVAFGIFTLSATATLELDSFCSSAATGGAATSSGDPEVYANIVLIKIG